MNKFYCLFLLALFVTAVGNSQTMRCGQVEYENYLRSQDPNYDLKQQQVEQQIQAEIAKQKKSSKPHTLYTIPVVIHVVYNTAAENLTDAELITAIDMLNKDYRRQNFDVNNTPLAFQPMAADVEIQFCLATVDPNGNPTTGIVHKQTTVTSFSTNDAVKFTAQGGDDIWDASKYMNIWVCDLGSSLLGYSVFPGGSSTTAGVVSHYKYTGPNGGQPYHLGRSGFTHEIGHFFNLRHIWGDANCGDDQVSDTPVAQTSNFGCPTFPHVTCSNGPNGDMFMNYMDYTDDACMNMFTAGQKTRMHAAVTGFYLSLTNGSVTNCSPPTPTADAGIVSIPYPNGTICASSISPQVTVINFGSSTLTSCTINYSLDGNTPQTLNWTGSLATGQPDFLTLSPMSLTAGTHTFVCFTSNPNNITDSNPQNDQLSVTFTSSAQPVVSVTGNTPLCTGESATLTAAGANSYSWSTGSSSASIVVSPTVTTTYSVTGSNGGTCVNTQTVVVSVANGLSITVDQVTNATGCVINDGSISISVSGGTGVYNYQWTPGNYTTEDITGLSSGSYAVYVTDANGCTASANATITNPGGFSATLDSIYPVNCNGNSNGKIFTTPSGGLSPYTFAWSNGASTEDLGLLVAGTYTALISDAAGCSFSLSANVTQPGALGANASATNISCAGNNNGSINLSVSGGTPPYSFAWVPGGQTTEDILGLSAGNYSVLVTDSKGCTASDSAAIISPPVFLVSPGVVVPSGCKFANGSITLNASGGTPPYTYSWSPSGGTTSAASGLFTATYSATVTDASGCGAVITATVGDSCDYVWPGDANDDGIASNMDIIAIGIGYGSTGAVRAGATTNWIGQPCADWTDTLTGNVNYKHIDCNGDGIVNAADTLAVGQNYLLVHNNKYGNHNVNAVTDIYAKVSTDTAGSGGSLVTVQIGLGTPSAPASDVYGIAYSIVFNDPGLVDLSTLSFKGQNSWLGTLGTDLMAMGFPNADAAVTRTNQTNASGHGFIHTLTFRTSNSLNGSGNSSTLGIGITNATVISFDETVIPVNQLSDSVILLDSALLNSLGNGPEIIPYPNPAAEEFSIHCTASMLGTEFRLMNVLGEVIFRKTFSSRNERIFVKEFPKGMYFLQMNADEGIVTRKIVKQ